MLPKTYQPDAYEKEIYDNWQQSGSFHAAIDHGKKPFTIVIPPPNITGQLHMGHALNNSIQDAIIRFKRMQGYAALYLPGTDHASIATEVKIVEQMAEGVTADIGGEEFLKGHGGGRKIRRKIIERQRLGSSCGWSGLPSHGRKMQQGGKHVFVSCTIKGIYRGDRIINWCPAAKPRFPTPG